MEALILEKISEKLKNSESSAMVTITNNNGSIPGKYGAIMGVFSDEVIGTIGGGRPEFEIINKAKECIENNKSMHYECVMNDKNGLACGGKAEVFIKVFAPKNKLVIFGSGHVARQIAKVSENLDFDIMVVDDREEYKTLDCFSNIKKYYTTLDEVFSEVKFDNNTYAIITTRGHLLDQDALERVCEHNVAYMGMIGSRAKTNTVFNNLKEKGLSQDKLNEVYAPIGLAIDNGTPEEIAFSIMSQILMIKNNKDASILKM